MKRKAAFLLIGIYVFCSGFGACAAEPVFILDFRNGINADVKTDGQWQKTPGSWSRAVEPEYSDMGVIGPALEVEHGDGTAWLAFDTPESAHGSGTFLFWVRGLENLDIFGLEAGEGFYLLYSWGTGGFGWTALAFIPQAGWAEIRLQGAAGLYPRFNMYKWNQVGFSWHEGRVRLYLNGDMVSEEPGPLPFERFAIGDYERKDGSRRLYDNVKIWDRLLTEAEVKHIWRQDGSVANSPLFTVPRMDTAPVIDGSVEPEEWSGAGRAAGMLEAVSGEEAVDGSAFYMGYDDSYLYIAMRGDMTELARTSPAAVMETFVRAEKAGRGKALYSDDTVELIISPDYWQADMDALGRWMEYKLNFQRFGLNPNKYFYDQMVFFQEEQLGDWREYRLAANSGTAHFESIYSSNGIDEGWSPEWDRASTVSNMGWQFEARLPLEELGRLPKEGEEWGFQISRIWQHLKQQEDVWSWGRRRDNGVEHDMYINREHDTPRASMGIMRFGKSGEPVVRVNNIGALSEKEVDWKADIHNPSAEDRRLRIRLFTDTDELDYNEMVFIPSGEKFELSIQHTIKSYATAQVSFLVENEKGELLHRTAIPFYLHQDFGVRVAQFPNYDRFLLDLDMGALSAVPAEELRVDIKVLDTDGMVVMSDTGHTVPSHSHQIEGSSKDIEPGDYIMKVAVRRGEEELGSEELEFVRPGRAQWYDNRYGYDDADNDRVPYPWTNMEVEDDAVEVWGRRYIFNNKLLPEQVTTLGSPVLRGPMRMIINTAGGDEVDTSLLEAESEWTLTNRTRVEGARKVDTGSFEITNSFWAEYDGLVWNRLTLEPKNKIIVDYMEIEIPISREFTDVIKAGGNVGQISLDGYRMAGHIYYLNPWLGNGDGGIQLFIDGDLHLKARHLSVIIDVPEEGAVVRMKIIDIPTDIDSAYEIEFGFIATPVRPNITRTPYFRSRSTAGGGTFYPSGLEFLPAPDPGADAYGGGSKTGRIYVWTSNINIAEDESGTADFRHYGAEWMKDPFQRPMHQLINPYGSKSFIDYFVWRHWRFQNKYGYGGLYYDNPSLGTFENRELIKRLYNVTLDNTFIAGRDAAMGLASNGIYNMAFGAFFSYQWNGEHLNSAIYANQQTYLGLLDPGVYRAEYMGHNWGWPTMFLGQDRIRREWVDANGGAEEVFDQIYGLGLIHDAYSLCCILPGITRQLQDRRGQDVNKLNLSHWKYQFTPYWRQDIVELPGEDMYASFYIARPSLLAATNPADHMGYPYGHRARTFRHYFKGHEHFPTYIHSGINRDLEDNRNLLGMMEDRAVMVVYNDTGWEGEMRLRVDWNKLGLGSPAGLSVDNYLHRTGFRVEETFDEEGNTVEKPVFFERNEEYARIEGDEIVFPMTGYNYRMIVIEQVNP